MYPKMMVKADGSQHRARDEAEEGLLKALGYTLVESAVPKTTKGPAIEQDLQDLTKTELLELGEKEGAEVKAVMSKAALIDAIELNRAKESP